MPGRRSPAASRLLSRFAGRRPVLRSRDAALASNRRSRLWSPPALPAPSNWAAQEWQRSLPNFGVPPSGIRAHPELHLSHWSGAVAELTLKADWSSRGKWRHVYGKLTYRGKPVYGFGATRFGVPTDPFGRNVYIDTLDSAYGPGWRRENSFLTRKPTGFFCYDFTPHRGGLIGQGREYRGTVIGPGVTPDVRAVVPDPGPYYPGTGRCLKRGAGSARRRRRGPPTLVADRITIGGWKTTPAGSAGEGVAAQVRRRRRTAAAIGMVALVGRGRARRTSLGGSSPSSAATPTAAARPEARRCGRSRSL